jgi:hypothetical protein
MKVVPIVPEDKGEGNTKPPPKKQVSPAKNWVFTLFNIEELSLNQFIDDARTINSSKILIGGIEICPESGKLHRHGVLVFEVKKRPVGLFKDKTVHWEKMKGQLPLALKYCIKDGEPSFVCDFALPRSVKPVNVLREDQLNAWELKVNSILADEPSDREIYWFFSKEGNVGKTTFAKYLYQRHKGNIVVIGGKSADSKNCVASFMATDMNEMRAPGIVILPVPRSLDSDFLSYEGMESIKDMFFYSGKYEGAMICDNPPHLVVFANQRPDRTKCSRDRWKVYEILDEHGNYIERREDYEFLED